MLTPAYALCSAPGKSLSFISYEKYHQLQGKRDDRSVLDAEGKSTGEPKTSVEPKKGKYDLILTDTYSFIYLFSYYFFFLEKAY